MDYDDIEMTATSVSDAISIGVGIAVGLVTAKELAKVLPKRTIAPIALAVQMAVTNVFADSIVLGRCANKAFRDYRKMEIVND